MNFLEDLKNRVIVFDGAMGTQVHGLNLDAKAFGGPEFQMLSDLLVFTRPDEVSAIHRRYFEAGADAVETNSFGASPMRLEEFDFSRLDLSEFKGVPEGFDPRTATDAEMAYQLAKRSAELAVRGRDTAAPPEDGGARYVVASVGPSNRVLSPSDAGLKGAKWEEIEENFKVQALGMIDGGADVILHETQQDLLELKAAILGSRKAMEERGKRLPLMAQVTVDKHSRMQIFHTDILAVVAALEDMDVDVIGINCSIGPDQMEATVERLCRHSRKPVSVLPNAGLPRSEGGQTVFQMGAEEFGKLASNFVTRHGVNAIGGCCGTTPDHIRELAKWVRGTKPKTRKLHRGILVSGPQNAVALDSSESLIRIGERLNVRGSKKVRVAVETEGRDIDFDSLEEVVREQTADLGIDLIDVCMDSNIVDTLEVLPKVLRKISTDFQGVFCIDSFDGEALVRGILESAGRPVLNSVSLEEVEPGVTKLDYVLSRTAKYGPVYIGLCAGPEGPAVLAEKKVELAREIMNAAAGYGVEARRLIIDMNVFPIGAESEEGMNFAMETLKSISGIKALHSEIMTSMGVGNLTNGLSKKPYMRRLLTSVFLNMAKKEGLDAAIVNPQHYVPVEELDEDDVRLARRIIEEGDMDAFARLEEIADKKAGRAVKKSGGYERLSAADAVCRKVLDGYKDRTPGELEYKGKVYEYRDRVVLQVAEVIEQVAPLDFINDSLMASMRELGDKFANGEVSLPHLLKSADVMKQVMGFLEKVMKSDEPEAESGKINYKGTVVLGTVYQDVHSIGKDLARTLLENYGYKVIDLGVQVPLDKFVEVAIEENADAIGMSALLVQTSNHMISVAKMLDEAGRRDIDLLIGGAPVSWRHAASVAKRGEDDGEIVSNNVVYCSSAMDGVRAMDALCSGDREKFLTDNQQVMEQRGKIQNAQKQRQEDLLRVLPRREIDTSLAPIAGEVASGRLEITNYEYDEVLPRINRKNLFAMNWSYGGSKGRDKRGEGTDKLEGLLEEWLKKSIEREWLKPSSVGGLFPACSDGDEVLIYEDVHSDRVVARLKFTAVVGADRKDVFSPAQFLQRADSGMKGVVGLQISTGGPAVDKAIEEFKKQDDNESSLMLQGLSDRIAEDLADAVHERLRTEVGAGPQDGTRYSPGYPAMRQMSGNRVLYNLLDAERTLGIKITEADEFIPTGTTAAVVLFHPDASYG